MSTFITAAAKTARGASTAAAALAALAVLTACQSTAKPAGRPAASPSPATTASAPAGVSDASKDAVLGTLAVQAAGIVTIPVTITNHSASTSSYLIQIEVLNTGKVKVADATAVTDNLKPGETAQVSAIGAGAIGGVSAVITNVTRYASP